METLKIRFESFWPKFNPTNNIFIDILRRNYNIKVLEDVNTPPDILIYSFFGQKHLRWRNCIRIYYSGEADYPNFNLCDYALGLVDINMPSRYLRFPLYIFYNNCLKKLENKKSIIPEQALKRDFCSIVVSAIRNCNPMRIDFFNELNRYKTIASGGRWNNNVGGPVPDKLDFIRNYKFNIAIENTKIEGYVTEKICEPFIANTVPIYWGADSVKKDFGTGGYIDISDFSNIKEAIEYIKEVDNDDNLYLKILNKGATIATTYDEWCSKLELFFIYVLNQGKQIQDYSIQNDIYNESIFLNNMRNSRIVLKYMKYLYPILKL